VPPSPVAAGVVVVDVVVVVVVVDEPASFAMLGSFAGFESPHAAARTPNIDRIAMIARFFMVLISSTRVVCSNNEGPVMPEPAEPVNSSQSKVG
jgi:hypothetical protein